MNFRVNCWIPPEHMPDGTYYHIGYRRETYTISRDFDNVQDAMTFVDNVKTSGQLDMIKGVLIMPRRDKKKLNCVEPLDSLEFSSKADKEKITSRRRYRF